jgi:hypothetical protein
MAVLLFFTTECCADFNIPPRQVKELSDHITRQANLCLSHFSQLMASLYKIRMDNHTLSLSLQNVNGQSHIA